MTSYEKYERLRGDVSNYQISKETGISQTTLSEWKSGRYTPNTVKLLKLARHFGVSIEDLMNDPV